MGRINGLLENFGFSSEYQKRLKKVEERALLEPDNLLIQVRRGDLSVILKRKKGLIIIYMCYFSI